MEENNSIMQNNESSQEEQKKIMQMRTLVEKQDPTSKVHDLMLNVQVKLDLVIILS